MGDTVLYTFIQPTALLLFFLLASAPYVARIRHPEQRPLAAYLLFTIISLSAFLVLFVLVARLLTSLGMAGLLDGPLAAGVYILLLAVPSIALGRWQARKAPVRRGPS